MNAKEALLKYFGYNSFRSGQEEIIEAIIGGNNVLALLPTSAGKSLCYQIPALISPNFSLVVSPLISLMKDQVDALNKNEPVSAFINSSVDFRTIERIFNDIALGKIKLLYVAPERFELQSFAERVKLLAPYYLFIDEAHCISEWGHNFRPSYRKIRQFIISANIKRIAAFTATATPEVRRDIIAQLGLVNPQIFTRGFQRDNIALNVIITSNKNQKVFELLSSFETPAIIYASSRKKAEELSQFLIGRKIKCSFYHAGLQPEERKNIQDKFVGGKIPVIAATNAFGMGIDKSDVRMVIHLNTPGTIESYYQEFGRAGRDGLPARAFLLYDKSDISIHNYFLANSFPKKEIIHKVYDAICDLGSVALGMISNRPLFVNYDFVKTVVKQEISKGLIDSILKLLADAGYIKLLSESEKQIFFSYNMSIEEMRLLVKATNENLKKEVLIFLLRKFAVEPFNGQVRIYPETLAEEILFSVSLFNEILESLSFNDIITIDKIIPRESIFITHPRVHPSALRLNYRKIDENFIFAQKKLDKMVDFVYSRECRFAFILHYFGDEKSEHRCGTCDNCLMSDSMPEITFQYLSESILKCLLEFKDGLQDTQLINILTGKTKSLMFMKSSNFGTCANYNSNDLIPIVHYLVSQYLLKRNPLMKDRIFLTDKGFETLKELGLLITSDESDDYEENLRLFHFLKEIRNTTAERFLQSKSIVCSDELLQKISAVKPQSKFEILAIDGFNERMYNKLGDEFVEIIRASVEQKKDKNKGVLQEESNTLQPNLIETLNLLLAKNTLEEIATKRNLAIPVVSMQVETILEYYPKTDVLFLINDEIYKRIVSLTKEGLTTIKEIKEKLGETVSFAVIRIALAKIKYSK